jgi:hypothetical protein
LKPESLEMDFGRAVIVRVFACSECGYVELYWAKEEAVEYQRKEAAAKAAALTAVPTPQEKSDILKATTTAAANTIGL